MKKPILALFAFLIINTASAQLFFSAGAGYAFPMAGGTNTGNINYSGSQNLYYTNGTNVNNFSIKQASFSVGLFSSLAAGYNFNEYFSAQLNSNMGVVNKKFSYAEDGIMSGSITPENITVTRQAKNLLLLIPSLVLHSNGDLFSIYGQMGVAIPVLAQISREEDYLLYVSGSQELVKSHFTEKNSFSLGVMAAAGIKYKLTDRWQLWAEISSLSMSLYIKEADIESYTVNGIPNSTSQPSLHFSKSGSYTNGTTGPTYMQPFSNIGLSAGIEFELKISNKSDRIYLGKKAGINYDEK